MEFVINRIALYEICKKAQKLANDYSPIEALQGLYLEADEDAGEVSVIATNYEASIFLKCPANVLQGGKLVIHAALLCNILEKLEGVNVEITQDKKNKQLINIASGKCRFTIMCLPGAHYPKPVMPFPEETTEISGVKELAKKICFAASKDEKKPDLQCICLNVAENSANAVATNTHCIMMAKSKATSRSAKQILIPANSFQLLASISNEDSVYDVGQVGNVVAFMCQGMLFSIKLPAEKYALDIKKVMASVKPEYTATVSSEEFREALDLCAIQNSAGQLRMTFLANVIRLQSRNEEMEGKAQVQADINQKTPASGFGYSIDHLTKAMQHMTGKIRIELDRFGMMFIKSKEEIYFQPSQKIRKESNNTAA